MLAGLKTRLATLGLAALPMAVVIAEAAPRVRM